MFRPTRWSLIASMMRAPCICSCCSGGSNRNRRVLYNQLFSFTSPLQLSNSAECPRSSARKSRMRCDSIAPRCVPRTMRRQTVRCLIHQHRRAVTSCIMALTMGKFKVHNVSERYKWCWLFVSFALCISALSVTRTPTRWATTVRTVIRRRWTIHRIWVATIYPLIMWTAQPPTNPAARSSIRTLSADTVSTWRRMLIILVMDGHRKEETKGMLVSLSKLALSCPRLSVFVFLICVSYYNK